MHDPSKDTVFGKLMKEWVNKEWPGLFTSIEHGDPTDEWVQISIEKEWTVIDIAPTWVSYRVDVCGNLDDDSEKLRPGDTLWKEMKLNIADPSFFEKLRPIVESSLDFTKKSAANNR
jgi:hypothetical protein